MGCVPARAWNTLLLGWNKVCIYAGLEHGRHSFQVKTQNVLISAVPWDLSLIV
jgi:hypothetical protein